MPPLIILSILSALIPLVIGIKKRYSLLWLYPLAGFIFDVLISFMQRVLHLKSRGLGNIYILLEFLILSFIYRKKIFKNDRLFWVFTGCLGGFFVVHTISRDVLKLNKVGGGVLLLAFIFYGIWGLYTILKEQKEIYLERSWFFWLNIALIIYASGSFLIMLFRDYIAAVDYELYKQLWNNVFLLLNIIKNILLGISIYHYHNHRQREPG